MRMGKYVIKRVLLMILTLFIITTICFMLIRCLEHEMPTDKVQQQLIKDRFEALGYNEPLLTQYGIYLRNIVTDWDWGTSWYIDKLEPAWDLLVNNLLPTVIVNVYSLVLSIPIGIMLGIYAAIKKNKWQDTLISTSVMIFVSVPSYVYAFLVQYFLYFKLDLFDSATVLSLPDAANMVFENNGRVIAEHELWKAWFCWPMLKSLLMPIMALSFGTIAGLTRFTRAELTETLTSDYMLLARTKGLTRSQATRRHAMKNAMVPILPMIISSFIGILGGSFVIEQIFSIPGVGGLYLQAVQQLDYDVFMVDSVFYVTIGLIAGIIVDLSYGFIDPRIRMGE